MCPCPPSQDSKVSTPLAKRISTIPRIPGSRRFTSIATIAAGIGERLKHSSLIFGRFFEKFGCKCDQRLSFPFRNFFAIKLTHYPIPDQANNQDDLTDRSVRKDFVQPRVIDRGKNVWKQGRRSWKVPVGPKVFSWPKVPSFRGISEALRTNDRTIGRPRHRRCIPHRPPIHTGNAVEYRNQGTLSTGPLLHSSERRPNRTQEVG